MFSSEDMLLFQSFFKPGMLGMIFKGSPSRLLLAGVFALPILISVWFVPWVVVLKAGVLFYFPYEPDGQNRYLRITGPLTSNWVSDTSVTKACRSALVASEDTRFYVHNGIDWGSVEESYKANQKKGKPVRGGSTLTQQLVKNAFLSRDKSMVRKAREGAGALLLDKLMSKEDQILWYLNIVEFGPRVYGIQEAAKFYFKKDAQDLTLSECVSLVAILPSPNKWNVSLLKNQPTPFFNRRHDVILARMSIMGYLDKATVQKTSKNPAKIVQTEVLPELPPDEEGDNGEASVGDAPGFRSVEEGVGEIEFEEGEELVIPFTPPVLEETTGQPAEVELDSREY